MQARSPPPPPFHTPPKGAPIPLLLYAKGSEILNSSVSMGFKNRLQTENLAI